MKLPLGCRFVPKDRELITYLSNKAKGLPDIGEGFITDGVDVYGTSPNDLRANGGYGKRYYFTPTKFKKPPSRCRDRRTPDGQWKAKTGKVEVSDKEGKMVGFVQDLRHNGDGGSNDGRTAKKWWMKEYTLPENDSSHHVALCVIYSTPDNTKKPDKNANSSQMLVQNQSTSPNNALQGLPPTPADGITTGCPNDDDVFNGLPPLELGSGLLGSSSRNDDDSNLASLKSDVGWQESLWLRNEHDSFLATFPSGSGLLESSFVDNEAASISETPLLEEFWNYLEFVLMD